MRLPGADGSLPFDSRLEMLTKASSTERADLMDRYLSAAEVAERLAVSRSWVYKHKRMLGGVQVGHRMWRFPEAGIQAYLSNRAESLRTGRHSQRDAPQQRRKWRLDY